MKPDEMKQLISAHQQAESKREEDAQIKFERKIEAYKTELYLWNDKVREWINNVEMMRQNGYEFYTAHEKSIYNLSKKEEKFAICTDTVLHTFGPWKSYSNGFGMAAGGACGDWHIVTDGEEWWIHDYYKKSPLRLIDYQRLLDRHQYDGEYANAIERFEKLWNELIDYLKANS